MSYPTDAQLDHWAVTLKQADWFGHVARLAAAINRDRRGGTAIPDGYPATTLAGSGGTSELTTVEAAVYARTQGARDEHHDRTRQAVAYLEQTVLSLAALVTHLDRIEARTVHVDGREPGCANCARHGFHEVRYRGDLGRTCYDFKSKFGQVPPFQLLDDHSRGIRWTSASITRAIGVQ